MNEDKITFAAWELLVDRLFLDAFMLTSDDFPDWAWRDAYDDGQTPQQAFDDYCDEHELRLE